MTNHHGWLLSQRVRNNLVNLLADICASGVEENVAAKALNGGATDPSTVLVKRTQDRLYPFPFLSRKFGRVVCFELRAWVSDDGPALETAYRSIVLTERYFAALASTTIVPVICGCNAQK